MWLLIVCTAAAKKKALIDCHTEQKTKFASKKKLIYISKQGIHTINFFVLLRPGISSRMHFWLLYFSTAKKNINIILYCFWWNLSTVIFILIHLLLHFGRCFSIILPTMEELKLSDVFVSFFLRLIFLSQSPGANKYFRHHYLMCVGLSTNILYFLLHYLHRCCFLGAQ